MYIQRINVGKVNFINILVIYSVIKVNSPKLGNLKIATKTGRNKNGQFWRKKMLRHFIFNYKALKLNLVRNFPSPYNK